MQKGYLVDIESPEDRIEFVCFESFSEDVSINYSAETIIGRSSPYQGYSDTGPRTFSLNLKICASINYGEVHTFRGKSDYDYVAAVVDWLRSLVYPDYERYPGNISPHRVLFCFGSYIKSVCIVTSLSVSYPGPFDVDTWKPQVAEVDLGLTEVVKIPYSCYEVRAGKDREATAPSRTINR